MVSAWSFISKRFAPEQAQPEVQIFSDRPERDPRPPVMRPAEILRDSGPLDMLGQRNELLRVQFGQMANRLEDLKSLNDDFAQLIEPFDEIFVELPKAKSRIMETEALLSRELDSGQALRREVDQLSSRLSAVSSEFASETARSMKLEYEMAQLASFAEETRLSLREKSLLLENSERQLLIELERHQSLAADLALQRAENQANEKALLRAEAALETEAEQRSLFETEARRLQQIVEDQLERVAVLQAQNADLAHQRERHLQDIPALEARLREEQAARQKADADHETAIAVIASDRSTTMLKLDAMTARLATTEQILGNVRHQFREKDEALRAAERAVKEATMEKIAAERRIEGIRGELAHHVAQTQEMQRLKEELADRCDMLTKALSAKDSALENVQNKAASLADRIDGLTKRYENDRLNQEAVNRRLIEELEGEKAERTMAQGALEIARENRFALQRQNETLKRAARSAQADRSPQGERDDLNRASADVHTGEPSQAPVSNVSFLSLSDK